MKLSLDHTQRLNLHALMGAQRTTVDEVRMWWRLQDMIDLNEAERKQINYRIETLGGMQQPTWDVDKKLASREFELTDDEFKKLERIIKEWQSGFFASADRRWLEPLLVQLDRASVNGTGATTKAAVPTGN
jgi:hypothetical protein